jgi:hypothetical protein
MKIASLNKTVSPEPVEGRPKGQRNAEGRTSTGSALTVCFEVAFYL